MALGEFEHIVLLAIMRLGEQAYGVSIRSEIFSCTGRQIAPGALYTTLDRLEGKRLVTSRTGAPTAERGGRAKRFYSVTSEGASLAREVHAALRSLSAGLNLCGESCG